MVFLILISTIFTRTTEWKGGDAYYQCVDWDCEFSLLSFLFYCGGSVYVWGLIRCLMSSTAVDWLSTLLEWIWILRHSSHSCPVQDRLASGHRPWEQVGQHWGVLRPVADALSDDLLLIFISAASMASLMWPTMPMCWSAAMVGCTGYRQLFIAALVPSKSPISLLIIRTAPWPSGATHLFNF